MNLILLEDHHFFGDSCARLSERYSQHLTQVLGVQAGHSVTVGRLNGATGRAQVAKISPTSVELTEIVLDVPPPPTLPLTLILALPRPRMLQRSLQTLATMGVEKLCLIQTQRVEKSFWQTPLLQPDAVHQQLILGLEQAKATQLPEVSFHRRFRPFMEDELPELVESKNRLIAHPGDYASCPSQPDTPTVLAIGPEGGFIPREVEQFQAAGFTPVQLGQRILRVETAIPVLLSRLFY